MAWVASETPYSNSVNLGILSSGKHTHGRATDRPIVFQNDASSVWIKSIMFHSAQNSKTVGWDSGQLPFQ